MFQRILHALTSALCLTFGLAVLFSTGCSESAGPKGWDEQTGPELYATAGCQLCHGANGEGSAMNLGPAYTGIKQYWTKEKLVTYMADPATFAKSEERLGRRAMPAIADDVTPAAREKLAEYVMSLMN